jgi:hypothetical protein
MEGGFLARKTSKKALIQMYVDRGEDPPPEIADDSSGRRRNKFNAQKVQRDGFTFDSKAEAEFYNNLVVAQSAGVVDYFLCQVPFRLPGGVKYLVDFQIFEANGNVRYVDVKGMETPMFRLKKKQVEALYPVKIEVFKK